MPNLCRSEQNSRAAKLLSKQSSDVGIETIHYKLPSSSTEPSSSTKKDSPNCNHDTSTTDHLPSTAGLIRELPTFISTNAQCKLTYSSTPALPRLFPPHNTLHPNRPRRYNTSRMLHSALPLKTTNADIARNSSLSGLWFPLDHTSSSSWDGACSRLMMYRKHTRS